MPNKLREYDCADCGTRTRRNRKSNDPWICLDCARLRMSVGGRRGGTVSGAHKRARGALQ